MASEVSDLPSPLTPPECDLRDFPYMPLLVERLRRSKAWLLAKRQPEIGFYMVNLWTGSWHEFPAASLEDDDDVLADVAMCSPARWLKCRDAVMRGWVKCADGRWYHPVVAEQAIDAWDRKTKRKEAGRKGNAVRWGSQSDRNTITNEIAIGSHFIAREGKGKEENKETSLRDAKKPRTKSKASLPPDWEPDEAGIEYARTRGVPLTEVQKFKRHHLGKGSVMARWDMAWQTWCENAVEWGKAPGLPLGNGDGTVERTAANPAGRAIVPMSGLP